MIKKICLLFIMALFLTGCIKTETQLTIKRNGSGFVEEKIYVDSALLKKYKDIKLNSNKERFLTLEEDNKLLFKSFENNKVSGLVGTRSVINFKEADWNYQLKTQTHTIQSNNRDKSIVGVKKGFFQTTYVIDCKIKPIVADKVKNSWLDTATIQKIEVEKFSKQQQEKELNKNNENNPEESNVSEEKTPKEESALKIIENDVKIDGTFKIKIPTRARSHNSKNVDTKNFVYKWDLKNGEETPIKLTFSVLNVVNIFTTLIILLLILAEVFYFSENSNKKTSKKR